jgi:hypothetical protein
MIAADILEEIGKERYFLLCCGYQPADLECHLTYGEWDTVRAQWAPYAQFDRPLGQQGDVLMGMPVTLHRERKDAMVRLRIGTPRGRFVEQFNKTDVEQNKPGAAK